MCRHAYLQSLPSREYLPLFWQEGELALLRGTELAGKAEADRSYSTLLSLPTLPARQVLPTEQAVHPKQEFWPGSRQCIHHTCMYMSIR